MVCSVSDFWQSEAYSLSILIAAFSGIWPYIKLILLGFCWIIPMKQSNREGIIIFLDQMGKFSYIDLFVSLYMIVSFYVSITKELKGYGINIKVVVEPDIGLNTFVIGTAISMIFSHFFLYLDAKYAKPHIKRLRNRQKQQQQQQQQIQQIQQIQQKEEFEDDDIEIDDIEIDDKHLKSRHSWNLSFRPLFSRFVPHSMFGVVIRALMLLTIIYTLWGTIETVFTAPVRYNITGLVGWAVTDPVRSYTPWQIVTEVPTHTDEHGAAGPLSVALAVVIIFCPILLIICMIIIWYIPLKYKHLNIVNVAMQTCMAWTALDVFAIASIAASLELSKVSQWILNQNYAEVCGPGGIIPSIMQKIIGKPVGCFSVDGYLVPGIYLVVAVAISSWILFIYTIHQLYHSKKYFNKLINKNIADKTIFFFNH